MNLFFDLLPMMLGTTLAPIWIIILLLILKSPNALVKGIAFVTGITIVRLLQGIIVGAFLKNAGGVETTSGPSPVVSTLLTVLGLLLLISAVKKLIKTDDLDAPPPKWMSLFDQANPLKLLKLGAIGTLVAPKLWVFTLSAIGIIANANLTTGEAFKTFLVYVAGAQSLLFLPLLVYAIAPRKSAHLINTVSNWLTRNNRPITIVVSTVFGIYFLAKGLAGLMKLT